MRILVIGSGGREHAWSGNFARARGSVNFVAPGNGGTSGAGAINVPVTADDLDALVDLARREKIDLVVPGPNCR